MNGTLKAKRVMRLLIGTSEESVATCLRLLIGHILNEDYEVQFMVRAKAKELRNEIMCGNCGIVVLFANTMFYEGGGPVRFHRVVDLVRIAKEQEKTIVMAITTFRPPGFAAAVEQAGADAVIDAPFTLDALDTAIRTGLELRA